MKVMRRILVFGLSEMGSHRRVWSTGVPMSGSPEDWETLAISNLGTGSNVSSHCSGPSTEVGIRAQSPNR